jgi:hypothetical protein
MINHLPYGSDNIDLKITQSKIAPSIFSFQENISKSLIKLNSVPNLLGWVQLNKMEDKNE